MRAHDLRMILLIQAIEESDTKGELLPLTQREAATQEALRGASSLDTAFGGDALSPEGEGFLTRRATHLHESVRLRAPIVDRLLAVTVGAARRDGLLVVALLSGVVLAALDGHRYIDILGASIWALLAWNLIVYALWVANGIRPRALSGAGVARLYARWMGGRAAAVLRHSRSFNAPLAAALPRFSTAWGTLAQALVMQRARRLFHLCAAIVALGLVVGLCVRGFVLRDVAGWSSSLIGAGVVRVLLEILYAPAAAIAGVALPAAAADVEALRVANAAAGGAPGAWIYLIALTLTLYIILPRMIAAITASAQLWRIGRNVAVPAAVVAYARRTLLAADAVASGNAL